MLLSVAGLLKFMINRAIQSIADMVVVLFPFATSAYQPPVPNPTAQVLNLQVHFSVLLINEYKVYILLLAYEKYNKITIEFSVRVQLLSQNYMTYIVFSLVSYLMFIKDSIKNH